jgi:hypothetical protein
LTAMDFVYNVAKVIIKKIMYVSNAT